MSFSGDGTITGLAVGGLPDATVTTADLTTSVSSGLAKSWVCFSGLSSTDHPLDFNTAVRVGGSTTVTITSTTPHGLITGNRVVVSSGPIAAGVYVVTVISDTVLTFTTVASTAVNSVNGVGFTFLEVFGEFNVSSIAYENIGKYWVNFSSTLPTTNYVALTSASYGSNFLRLTGVSDIRGNASVAVFAGYPSNTTGTTTFADVSVMNVGIFY